MPYELSRRLAAGPLLCDGAMGVLNLNNPRVIQSIRADYIAAVPALVGILPLHSAHQAGACLMPSFGRFEVVAEVLDAIG